mmetsp:Transcript_73661/g.191847  ORF Transcript_73661/g.191847 Transcript_73661/m.191847 type:complete len:464 (+) Transcript_73661:1-1392(+)
MKDMMGGMMGMDPKMMGNMMGGMMPGGGNKDGHQVQAIGGVGMLEEAPFDAPPQLSLPAHMPAPGARQDSRAEHRHRRSPSRSPSRSPAPGEGRRRSPSYSAQRRPQKMPAHAQVPPPTMMSPTVQGGSVGTTLSSMLGTSKRQDPPAAQATPEDPARAAARKAAASAAAAAFLQTASKVAETSRDAARDAATAKAAAPVHMEFTQTRPDRPRGLDGGHFQTDFHRPAVKLWLPEPSVQQEPETYNAPPPPPSSGQQRGSSPARRRSRSRRRERVPSPIGAARRRRGGGWDSEQQAQQAPLPPPMPSPSQMPVAQSSIAQPSRPALPPGSGPGARPPGMHVPVNRFGVPEATPEALAAAVFRAQQVEAAGLEAIRATGQIPRGPPDLPTGTEVIEQKCVAYLIGKGGQALAAINAAAGVSIQIDQSTKTFGWSMANIYGTEEGSAKAKMILRQKVSEYRPLRT